MSTIQLESREAWLAERKNGLGASDVSAALGINPWKSPFALWAEKCGLLPDEDLASENEAIRWGLRLERSIAEAFGEESGREITFPARFEMAVHPRLPFLRATLDAMQRSPERPSQGNLQIKTTSAFNRADWANDQVPLWYQVQVQVELAVSGFEWGTIACLMGGQRMVWRDMERDDDFLAALIPHLETFWQCVEDRVAPEVDSLVSTGKILAALHPDDNGETVELPAEAADWDLELRQCKEKIAILEELKTLNENRIKAALADATFGQLPNGETYSFKTQARAEHIVKGSKFRVLRRLKG